MGDASPPPKVATWFAEALSLIGSPQAGKSTTIRRTAVREAGVSLCYHWDPIEVPPETSSNITALWYRGVQGGPQLGPITPRGTSLELQDHLRTANGHCPFAVPNQSENGKHNLILV